ncbi:hypothetical protein BHM03_00057044 [Ensete ventricosum]|nr:hypothetical protein BHM03_00057044 [Ensete ventricosum]
MARVLLASRLECDVEIFIMRRPLSDLRACIGFARRGAVTARGWLPEDDVDLLLDRTFGSRRRISRRSTTDAGARAE